MFQLIFFIVSYGALLLLLMHASLVGLVAAALLAAAGIVLILRKKIYRFEFPKKKWVFPAVVALACAAVLGVLFIARWQNSLHVRAVANILHISQKTLLLIGMAVLALLSFYFIFFLVYNFFKLPIFLNRKFPFAFSIFLCVIASVAMVLLSQFMILTRPFSMGIFKFLLAVLMVLIFLLFLYGLIGKINLSIFIGCFLLMLISTINHYVYSFRERLFEPVDIFSAGTAMNVVDNYSLFPVPIVILIGWFVFAAMMMVFLYIRNTDKPKNSIVKRAVLLGSCILCAVTLGLFSPNFQTYHWKKDGATLNGYLLDFVYKFKEISASQPVGYNPQKIAALAEKYTASPDESETLSEKPPHIIVIMDEAFSDLRVLGDFATNREVIPFISSLKENTISGYALASVYAGNTANSEYEFLTGNSMAWLAPNAVPFQQYVRSPAYSMVSYLKSVYGYNCVAMHPYLASGWNRPSTYANFGFDDTFFIEAFPREHLVRKYVSDREMFDFLIETYEARKNEPLFLFGVTMQNHGHYNYTGPNYTRHIYLTDYEGQFPEVEQYLSVIYETDMAVERLITYFQNADEDVIIVFFGDHQPYVKEEFLTTVCKFEGNSLEQKQKSFLVPFFIWTNYDIEEEYIDCIGLNVLPNYMYRAAGIALPPYNQFLQEFSETIPAINANGFYSLSSGCFLPFDQAGEEEQEWLRQYEMLQYNNIFDKKHKNEVFFPALK